MSYSTPRRSFPRHVASLALSNGRTWSISAADGLAYTIVSQLAETMQLGSYDDFARQLIVSVEENDTQHVSLSDMGKGTVTCYVQPAHNLDMLALQFAKIVWVIILDAEQNGGMLLHGALAERDEDGVILVGPSGIGKTTTSQRFSAPWHSLCDDSTLVVRDKEGTYWAHPWPTWSEFMFGGTGGSWDSKHAVPLRALFFLDHARQDRVVSIKPDQVVGSLLSSSEQVTLPALHKMKKEEVRAIRLRRFDNVWALMQTVPCYRLYLSRDGEFWREIERALDINKG